MTYQEDTINQIIEFAAARATKRAAIAARRGIENRGFCCELGSRGQKGMHVRNPTRLTEDHRNQIAARLTGMGFTVSTNTKTDKAGRTTFASFRIIA